MLSVPQRTAYRAQPVILRERSDRRISGPDCEILRYAQDDSFNGLLKPEA